MPKVSVVVPVFNGERFIKDSIDSVLNQTFRDIEIIVVDDGSTDRTAEIVRGYGCKLIYRYQHNQGADIAYNVGISMASGEYVAFLDHDDRWYPEKVETQVSILNRCPDIGLTYSELDGIDEFGTRIEQKTWVQRRRVKSDILTNFRAVLKRQLPVALPSAMMVRRGVLKSVGGFDESLAPGGGGHADSELFILAGVVSQIYFVVRPLAQYRVHNWQGSHQRREEIRNNYIILLDGLWNRWKNCPEDRALLIPLYGYYWSRRGKDAYRRKDLESARQCLVASLRYRPFYFPTWIRLLRLHFRRLFCKS